MQKKTVGNIHGVSIFFAVMLIGALISASDKIRAEPAAYDFEPVYIGSIGEFAPLDLYPVAVAFDGTFSYEVDQFRLSVRKRDLSGNLVYEFPLEAVWPRDIEVDSNGNVYTMDQAGKNLQAISQDAQVPTEDNPNLTVYQEIAWSKDSQQLAFTSMSQNTESSSNPISASLYTSKVNQDGVPVKAFESDVPVISEWRTLDDVMFMTVVEKLPNGIPLLVDYAVQYSRSLE